METEILNDGDSVHQIPFGNTEYARTTRELNDIINALRQCGANDMLNLSLPIIAVIGNQSVGKSSLIEAISEIGVPRSVGTCTRCPMEVRLRTAVTPGQWTCNVSVQLKEPKYGFFDITNTREKVESILRRAQLASLNPNKNLNLFSRLTDDECAKYEYVLGNEKPKHNDDEEDNIVKGEMWDEYKSEVTFSKNRVVVEITGSDVDVTFIDLPGIIHNGVCLPIR